MRRRVVSTFALAAVGLFIVACADSSGSPAPAPPAVGDPPAAATDGSPALDSPGATTPAPAATGPAEASPAPETSDTAFDFPTGPAVLVPVAYEPPTDRVDSTGAYLPVNGKPTVVVVDAIWCPLCALTRPIFHSVRPEYQDDVNLVVLDFDRGDDAALARSLGAWAHPAWAVVAPDSNEVLERRFGPLNERALRAFLDGVRDAHASGGGG